MRRSPFFTILLVLLGATLLLLLVRPGGDVLGMDAGRFAQLALLAIILLFLVFQFGGAIGLGRTLRFAFLWAIILGVVLIGYTYRDELGDIARRVGGEIVPGQPMVQTATEEVVISRMRGGHFVAATRINNATIDMMIDTGASVVTLTPEDARLAGITTRQLDYRVPVQTANGMTMAAAVVIDRIMIGGIERRRVAALVTQPGMLETSLLGLNFLSSLRSYTFTGGRLILSP
ncbi:MAG: TIGR02281 family clan AA aspartic protease [Bauldia sp.]